MQSRLTQARNHTVNYHIDYYNQHELFEAGSWLEKPDRYLEKICNQLKTISSPVVLDLGAGVGRNSIPLAQNLNNAQIDSVDLLEIACDKLKQNAIKHNVQNLINTYCADLETFSIKKNHYDLIFAVSVLEHCSSFEKIIDILDKIIAGSKPGAINRLEFTTNRNVIDIISHKPIETKVETALEADSLKEVLLTKYQGWDIQLLDIEPYKEELVYNGQNVLWQSSQLNFIAQKN